MAGHDDCGARARKLGERRPELPAKHGVKTHRRLVEHQDVGPAEQRHGEGDPGALPAGQLIHQVVVGSVEANGGDGPVDVVAADSKNRGEEGEVLPNRQVRVHARRLGDVADSSTQPGAPGGLPSTVTVPDSTIWTPTIARIRVLLPQPEGPSKPVI